MERKVGRKEIEKEKISAKNGRGVAKKNFRGPNLEGAKTSFPEGVIKRAEGAREKFSIFLSK